jgi:hypothetical protein
MAKSAERVFVGVQPEVGICVIAVRSEHGVSGPGRIGPHQQVPPIRGGDLRERLALGFRYPCRRIGQGAVLD